MRRTWVAVVVLAAGCRGHRAAPAPADARTAPPPADAASVGARVVDAPPALPEVTCSSGVRAVDALVVRDDHVIACFDDRASCWHLAVTPTPTVTPLPRASWPAPTPTTTATTAVGDERLDRVTAPPGWSARTTVADDDGTTVTTIEVCSPAGCSTVPLVPARGEGIADHVEQVLVDDAGTAVAVTRGSTRALRMISEIYDLPAGTLQARLSPRARRLSPVSSGGQCSAPTRWLGPTLVVSESDCEWPGDDLLYDRRGRRLATIAIGGDDATTVTYHRLDDRHALVVVDGARVERWDVVAGRRFGRTTFPRAEDSRGLTAAVGLPDGAVVVATDDGTLLVLDDRLRERGRVTLPPCPPAPP